MQRSYKIFLPAHRTLFSLLASLLLSGFSAKVHSQYPSLFFLYHHSATDTSRIMATINKGIKLKDKNQDSALYYLYTALEESKKRNYNDGIGYALFGIGLTYIIWNNSDAAMHNFDNAIIYCKNSLHYKYIVPALYSNIGYLHYIKGSYPTAISYFDSSIREGLRIGLPTKREHLAVTLNNLGGIHIKLEQIELALKYLNQAEDICRKGNFPPTLALTLDNKAAVCKLLKQEEKAEQYYKEGIEIATTHSDIESVSTLVSLKTGLAELKLKQGKAQEALQLLKEVQLNNYTYYKEHTSISPTYTMGRIYLQLKDYKNAEHYLLKALKESAQLDIKDYLTDIYKALTTVYDSTGHYAKALHYHYAYEQLKDSLLNKEKAKDINELDIKYRTSEKDRELVEKKLQISEQQNRLNIMWLWIGGILLGTLFLTLLFIIRIRANQQKHKDQARQIHILNQQQDLLMQQQEINHLNDILKGEEKERIRIARELHDGIVSKLMAVRLHFNGALQHATSLTDKTDFENTLQYLDEATTELRKTAHNLMPETVLQGGLLSAVSTYCDMLADATDIEIRLQHFGTLNRFSKDVELSLYRTVQELVLNAVKHAQCTRIVVEVIAEDNYLSITVEDNGTGITKQKQDDEGKMGLKSVHTRIKALNGKIDISGREGAGTSVNMEFDTREFEVKN